MNLMVHKSKAFVKSTDTTPSVLLLSIAFNNKSIIVQGQFHMNAVLGMQIGFYIQIHVYAKKKMRDSH